MLIRALALLACLLTGPVLAQSDTAPTARPMTENPFVDTRVDELRYGIYCAQDPLRREPAPETASGHINIVPEIPAIRFEQVTVPATRGVGFGVLVRLQPGLSLETAQVTVTHPPFRDSGVTVERWITAIDGEGFSLMGFTFDTAEEEVPGEWTFTAEFEGEELFHIAFDVVPGAAMPGIALACMGGALS